MVTLDTLPRKKLCVDLIVQKTCSKDKHKYNILLEPFSLNKPAQKVYITNNLAIKITNLAESYA